MRIFHEHDKHHILKNWNQVFLGSGGSNEPNGRSFVSMSEIKIFHEQDVRNLEKVGNMCF